MGVWDGTPTEAEATSTVKIKFRDSSKANQTITVEVDRSDSVPASDIEIQLDANGCGEKDYTVPSGPASIEFSTAGHPSHVMGVTYPPG